MNWTIPALLVLLGVAIAFLATFVQLTYKPKNKYKQDNHAPDELEH